MSFFFPARKAVDERWEVVISLWEKPAATIVAMDRRQIGTYRFLVPFLTIPSPHVCTYVDSTVRCPFTKIVPIIRSGSSKGSHHGISVDSLLVQCIFIIMLYLNYDIIILM